MVIRFRTSGGWLLMAKQTTLSGLPDYSCAGFGVQAVDTGSRGEHLREMEAATPGRQLQTIGV
jgi:hypothetical protein